MKKHYVQYQGNDYLNLRLFCTGEAVNLAYWTTKYEGWLFEGPVECEECMLLKGVVRMAEGW